MAPLPPASLLEPLVGSPRSRGAAQQRGVEVTRQEGERCVSSSPSGFSVSAWCSRAPRATHAQATPPDRAKDAAQIRTEIERICQAFVDKDRSVLTATHGKDWRGFTPWSDHVIRGLDGYMNEATFEPGTPKGQGMVGYRLSDFDVVFYGDTAVASFVLDLDIVNGTDKRSTEAHVDRRLSQGAEGLDPGRVEHFLASGRDRSADVAAPAVG